MSVRLSSLIPYLITRSSPKMPSMGRPRMLLMFVLLHCVGSQLIYPDPSKVQFIAGFGFPINLDEESLVMGIVLKCNYQLPVNSSEITAGYVTYAKRSAPENEPRWIFYRSLETALERSLFHKEDSTVMYCSEDPKNKSLSRTIFKGQRRDRRNKMESGQTQSHRAGQAPKSHSEPPRMGLPGRECILRSICEAATASLKHEGIIGELIHLVLTPSASEEMPFEPDAVYHQAEVLGRSSNPQCNRHYSSCPMLLIDFVTNFYNL